MVQFFQLDPRPSFGEQLSQAIQPVGQALQARRKRQEEAQFSKDFAQWLEGETGEKGEPPPKDPSPSTEVVEGAEVTKVVPEQVPAKKPTPKLKREEQIRLATPKIKDKLTEDRELRKEGREYVKNVTEKGDKARKSISALNTQLAAIREGEVGPLSWGHLAEMTGIEALHTPGSAAFKSAGKQLFGGIMDVFGKRILQAEIPIWEGQMAKIGRKEAPNELVVRSMMVEPLVEWKRRNIVNELREKGVSPGKIEQQTNKQIETYVDSLYEDWHKTMEKAVGKKIGGSKIASPEEAREELNVERSHPTAKHRVKNPKTGEILEWTGTTWRKVR